MKFLKVLPWVFFVLSAALSTYIWVTSHATIKDKDATIATLMARNSQLVQETHSKLQK